MRPTLLGPASLAVSRQLADVGRLAAECGHSEAVQHLARRRKEITEAEVRVAVVGEFKQGKSTLVNALIRTDVCPVDEDVVTALPTVVRWGERPGAAIVTADGRFGIDLPSVAGWVRGTADSVDARAVEVLLDRGLLRRGLSLIDTPGVGGLESAHGQLTKATLTGSHAALFVTDASQELTAPELDFLEDALTRCREVIVVLTKIDLFVQWRRILDLDRSHLVDRGLDVATVAVSSFLRMRAAAAGDRRLNERSGYPQLMELLSSRVLASADEQTARPARQELDLVTRQLSERLDAEREVLRHGERGEAVVAWLTESSRRSQELVAHDADWMQVLQDGLNDLAKDLSFDLRSRLRRLLADGEEALATTDPARGWSEFEPWAQGAAAAAAVQHLQQLVEEAEALSRRVAERFMVAQQAVVLDLPPLGESLNEVNGLQAEFRGSRVRQALGAMAAARVAYYGVVASAAAAPAIGAVVVAPAIGLAVGAGVLLTRFLVRDERERQLEVRRGRARQAFRSYVDDVGFALERESSDAVRRVQRQLRDEFSRRARLVSAGARLAVDAAQEATRVPDPEARLGQVERRRRRLDELTAATREPGHV